jgi:hypothetical protein
VPKLLRFYEIRSTHEKTLEFDSGSSRPCDTFCVCRKPYTNFKETANAFVGHDLRILRGKWVNSRDFDGAKKVELATGNSTYLMPYIDKGRGICMLEVEVNSETGKIVQITSSGPRKACMQPG